jgi:hypothetical protein
LRSFQTPRLSLAVLIVGLALQMVARSRMAAGSEQLAREGPSLDSAITAALPSRGDTAEASVARMRTLVSRKRDLEVEANATRTPWFFVFLASGGFVLAALVTGTQALVGHIRGEA